VSTPRFPGAGHHTAHGGVLDYRLDKIERHISLSGDWLDLGCADGYYAVGLAQRGASSVVGAEINPALVAHARTLPHPDNVTFALAAARQLPFDDNSFDRVLLNEVFEHVDDEATCLFEINRVLRPDGILALFSPNRWFAFEGHGIQLNETRWLTRKPAPLMPWLPRRLTYRVATARNYWPYELARHVQNAHLSVVHREWALAQFEQYPWLPLRVAGWYRDNLVRIERSPVARFFAVSTFILAASRKDPAPRAAPNVARPLAFDELGQASPTYLKTARCGGPGGSGGARPCSSRSGRRGSGR
jgi:ubiquinone/menaquinone biosynthesis C-methylase UbiE